MISRFLYQILAEEFGVSVIALFVGIDGGVGVGEGESGRGESFFDIGYYRQLPLHFSGHT